MRANRRCGAGGLVEHIDLIAFLRCVPCLRRRHGADLALSLCPSPLSAVSSQVNNTSKNMHSWDEKLHNEIEALETEVKELPTARCFSVCVCVCVGSYLGNCVCCLCMFLTRFLSLCGVRTLASWRHNRASRYRRFTTERGGHNHAKESLRSRGTRKTSPLKMRSLLAANIHSRVVSHALNGRHDGRVHPSRPTSAHRQCTRTGPSGL